MDVGRPSDYRPEFCHTAANLAAQGATDREIAEELEISERTLYRWRHAHPEFRQALQVAKEAADERVENALYRRAIGYSFDALKIMQYEGQIVTEPYVEHVPPDVNAAKFWLMNRRSQSWKDKQDVQHSGTVNVTLQSKDADA